MFQSALCRILRKAHTERVVHQSSLALNQGAGGWGPFTQFEQAMSAKARSNFSWEFGTLSNRRRGGVGATIAQSSVSLDQFTIRSLSLQYSSRSLLLSTLPTEFFGSASAKSTDLGAL